MVINGLYIIACIEGRTIYNFLPHIYTNEKQAKNALTVKINNATISSSYAVYKLDQRTTFMNMKKVS